MNITWTSQKGLHRRSNSDAAAVGYSQEYLVIVVVDAAEKSINGRLIAGTNDKRKRLAQYWADSCMCELVVTNNYKKEEALVNCLHEKQKGLREHYLHDIASYGVFVLNTKSGEFDWWFTGDCRLGIQTDRSDIKWLSTPHRLENSPLLSNEGAQALENEQDQLTARHTLSKSLNARRFYRPEKVSSLLASGQSIVIATDGYWCEHLIGSTSFDSLEDDASLLTIKPGKRVLKLKTDTPNLLAKYR